MSIMIGANDSQDAYPSLGIHLPSNAEAVKRSIGLSARL
jgi:hypothetical protein